MEEFVVSEHRPPGRYLWVAWFERGLDPWHPDAFVGIEGIHEAKAAMHDGSSRRSGWYAVDYCGNTVGWYADGTKLKYSGIGPRPLEHVDGDFGYVHGRIEHG